MKIEQDVSLIQAQILALCDEMQGLEDDKDIAERFEAIGLCEAAMAALEAKAPATAES